MNPQASNSLPFIHQDSAQTLLGYWAQVPGPVLGYHILIILSLLGICNWHCCSCERRNSGDLQPCIIINDPDPIDPREIFKKLHLEHIKHLVRVSEHKFDRGHSLVLRCYRQMIDDMYESVTADRRVCKKFNLLYGKLGLIHSIQSHHVVSSHSRILTMPLNLNLRCSLQKKAKEELKTELLQRILQHFNDHPELKKNQRYEGLFNLTRSRRRRLENDNVAPEFPQDMIPPNSIHQPSRYPPQPVAHSSMLGMDPSPPPAMHLHTIQCTIEHSVPQSPSVLHPHFAPVGRPLASTSQDFQVGGGAQMYDIGGSGNAGQLYESGLYQQYRYNPDNYYMNHDPQ
ncbi:hypothetical protein F4604DRAFT_1907940 [Suillus subluteus]|nr:hypothetical protein F4604DRAFT_1907940 [Suillus subluteus]